VPPFLKKSSLLAENQVSVRVCQVSSISELVFGQFIHSEKIALDFKLIFDSGKKLKFEKS